MWMWITGHHADQHGAVLGAVNATVLRTDRGGRGTRLRALTAPPRSAMSWHLRDGLEIEWLTLTSHLGRAYSANISLVSS
jgi:hypothetical protein